MESLGSEMHVNKLGSTVHQKLHVAEAPIQMPSAQMAHGAYSSASWLIPALTRLKKLGFRVQITPGEPERVMRRQPLQGFPGHWSANSLAGYGLPG